MSRAVMSLFVCLVLAQSTYGDHYGAGLAKSTTSASNPLKFYKFLAKYFPVQCQDQATPCNTTFNCGTSGRAALCTNDECAYDPSIMGGFGIHLVNMSARPFGESDNWEVEGHFTAKFRRAVDKRVIEAFTDYTTVLYSTSLNSYLKAFARDAVPHQVLSWNDDTGAAWWSLLVQISTSQLIFELISSTSPQIAPAEVIPDHLSRLPAQVFAANNVSALKGSILLPLAVSKATSNMSDIVAFYHNDMQGQTVHVSRGSEGTELRTFALPGADALVRFVERPHDATFGAFTVADLEEVKHSSHRMAHVDIFCGVDKYFDNHYAYDGSGSLNMDGFKARFDHSSRIYHVFGDCMPSSTPGPGTNLYVVDPTGDAVQVDGVWENCPKGGSGDALVNACSQGACRKYKPTAECSTKLSSTCSTVRLRNATCTDCAYINYPRLQRAGCTNADVVNFCT